MMFWPKFVTWKFSLPTLPVLMRILWLKSEGHASKLEKRITSLGEQIETLKSPLSDAMAILREMVIGDPVESMFETLEKGDLKRINQMLSIKHQIDSIWQGNDTLLNSAIKGYGD